MIGNKNIMNDQERIVIINGWEKQIISTTPIVTNRDETLRMRDFRRENQLVTIQRENLPQRKITVSKPKPDIGKILETKTSAGDIAIFAQCPTTTHPNVDLI